ncbi:hypothetical protein PPERSA_08285 [Pseudocohnilembus persalinus]|uniref:Uncharacterized protein n=1 Tax=Pseudocohnilembus persalinus TaxID=266149 RepID=A0A0V0QP71_PSEPJ|nr:hypothetical protein PPERSA_08285 [Pseudocohnilembus persalinus]|eukprot:KRX04070.1 hypothetical protein PPERSA_08285 [Pseudocohnilembus persalinus]
MNPPIFQDSKNFMQINNQQNKQEQSQNQLINKKIPSKNLDKSLQLEQYNLNLKKNQSLVHQAIVHIEIQIYVNDSQEEGLIKNCVTGFNEAQLPLPTVTKEKFSNKQNF